MYEPGLPLLGFSTQIWDFSSPSGRLGLILTNPVKSVFFKIQIWHVVTVNLIT